MKFQKTYFDSGREYNKNKGVYLIRDSLPFKNLISRKSKEHLNLFLMDKWKLFNGCKKVLDAGCGRGEFLELNPYKTKVIGVDIIKEEVKKLKEKGLDVQYADLKEKLPFKDNSFDGVLNSHVLEHLDPEEGIKMISEFKRVLTPGGILVIAVPNFSFKRFYSDYSHKRPYPKEALFRILYDSNFYSIKIINGAANNHFLSGVSFFSPKLRFWFEKFFGMFSPWEIIAIARNKK
jgi:SAM-dependent methyltransferase